jgi:hypothetical protein
MNVLKKRLVFVVAFLLCVTALSGCYRLPSEKSLLKLFNENRAEFEALIKVAGGVTYLSADHEALEKKLDIWESSTWTFKDLKQNSLIFFIGDAKLLNSADYVQRGIAYIPEFSSELDKKIVPSLDREILLSTYLFQRIEGNWYLFQETTR